MWLCRERGIFCAGRLRRHRRNKEEEGIEEAEEDRRGGGGPKRRRRVRVYLGSRGSSPSCQDKIKKLHFIFSSYAISNQLVFAS